MHHGLVIRTLGALTIHLNGQPMHESLSSKAQALLVYLVCTRDVHSRDTLAEFLWEGRSQNQALTNLRKVVYQLHQVAGSHLWVTRHTISLHPECDCALDVEMFEAELSVAEASAIDRVAHLACAAELYKGDFLTGFSVRSPVFEGWALLERERLRFHIIHTLDRLVELYVRQRQYSAAEDCISRLLHIDPLREKTHLDAMRLLLSAGQREAALRQYEAYQLMLRDEMNIAPSLEMLGFYERLQTGQDVDSFSG